jgi:hypothetical protein
MTLPPNTEIELVTQEFLENEFQKPEWQARLSSCSIRHLRNAEFPPSDKFPNGGTTMLFEMVCNDATVALLAKFISPRKEPYKPEWRPQALLLGTKWSII